MSAKKEIKFKFLNVGQGDCTHIVLPNGKHMVVDINLDRKNKGINVIDYLSDTLPAKSGKKGRLAYFVNTHPHDDHICGVADLRKDFEIDEMWHSGHELDCEKGENPNYDELQGLIKDLGDKAKKVCACADAFAEIDGASFHIFRPSSYVKLDKDKASEEKREAIHNECIAMKVSFGGKSVMITGDTNKGAWESITKHYDRDGLLGVDVLQVSHHGSRTFFKKKKEEDESWEEHMEAMSPSHLVISVGADNSHGHPHADALRLYKKHVTEANTFRTDKHLTVVLTIDEAGKMTWSMDDAVFQSKYELPGPDKEKGSGGKGGQAKAAAASIVSRTRLGDKSPTA